LNDPQYNIHLGRTYLERLVSEFDGSYVLALAAYNAGPGRVRQWLREQGDPRHANVDVIDWIEQIPFEETRNYIQRVLENLQVYRHLLGSQQLAQGLPEDLRRGAN
jgi:soluble lytic murein transglycosylase